MRHADLEAAELLVLALLMLNRVNIAVVCAPHNHVFQVDDGAWVV